MPALADPRYAALWERSPGRSPFSHPAAVAAYARAFDLPARILAVEDDGGEWTAAVPVFEKRRGPFVASALPPLCPVHRPLLAEPLSEAATHERRSPLDDLLTRLDAETDQATFALGDDDLRPYAWAGWTATPRATYHLALDGDVEARFSSDVRRRLRRDAAAFEVVEDPALAATSVALMDASYLRHGTALGLDVGAMTRVAEALQAAGLARTVAARRGGEVEAAVVVASDGRTASYWIAGSVPGSAMTVVIRHVLHRLADEGVETFDFCGANTPSIAEFKRRFGSVLAPAPIARRVSHPALRLADRLRPR
ncbi:GNAT family N-acetyltransferase [Rubrivirga sp.]|uniref:GNAT family N-acetyltransferase n=1 Tax=Rubrivirga sp. TaxID=1885344 RepID=UPI003B525E02